MELIEECRRFHLPAAPTDREKGEIELKTGTKFLKAQNASLKSPAYLKPWRKVMIQFTDYEMRLK
jgi:hypothetical protein